jgi:polar amino acid transport system substrate-binding protein
MQRFRTLVAVLFIFFLTNMGYCDDLKVITVASEEWENNTNKDETGLYWDIIRKVYQMDNIQLKTRIVPYARSVHMVKVKKVDAWVASYIDEETFAIYPKWHFDADIVSALFQKSKFPDWKGVQSLANKTVGWVRGYDYDQYIDVKMKIDELNSRDSAVGMLVKNRIDVLLDALVEIQNELKKKERLKKIGFDLNEYRIEQLLQLNLYLAFTKDERGKKLMAIWDKNFEILLKNGSIKKLFEHYKIKRFPFKE